MLVSRRLRQVETFRLKPVAELLAALHCSAVAKEQLVARLLWSVVCLKPAQLVRLKLHPLTLILQLAALMWHSEVELRYLAPQATL
jgi:hypothetical protein